ncbi:polysaccharide pyruvyl transferase family protein [Clostridium perfringens]|nr:polysaccharide pyruvyl transferase family protein [Clostridium perfringens]
MKKIFVDVYLAFNLGDDLFVDILSKKYPNAQFTLNYVGNNYDEFIKNYNNLKRRKYDLKDKLLQKLNLKNTLTNYGVIAREYDAIIFIGGSIFRDESYHKELYKERISMISEFEKLNKPIFVLGSNFGPYENREFINDYREFFKRCTDVCFRDKYSYNLFRELPNVRYAPDIVFQLDLNKYKKANKKKVVGFSIIDVNHKVGLSKYSDEYINSTIKSIEMLINKGYNCCLMSFCEFEGDLRIIEMILSNLNKNYKKKVHIYRYNGKIEECFNVISDFKLFVAARFHANILAQLLEIPVLPVIYSDKTLNMLKDIGNDKLNVTMNQLNMLYNERILEEAFNNKCLSISSIKNEASQQFNELSKFIFK